MPRKRFSVEQIINHLREADVLLAQGRTVGEVCRQIGMSEQTYYRWRKEYGGQSPASYMESAADWPQPITRVPRKPKVAQFCAAPWPNFTPPLTPHPMHLYF